MPARDLFSPCSSQDSYFSAVIELTKPAFLIRSSWKLRYFLVPCTELIQRHFSHVPPLEEAQMYWVGGRNVEKRSFPWVAICGLSSLGLGCSASPQHPRASQPWVFASHKKFRSNRQCNSRSRWASQYSPNPMLGTKPCKFSSYPCVCS